MRATLPFMTLACATAAAADTPQAPAPMLDRKPLTALIAPPATLPSAAVCRDRIQQVREARGLPKADDPAPEAPLMIAAVDHRIGNCSVMVMYHDTSDVRPVPTAQGQPRVRRIQ